MGGLVGPPVAGCPRHFILEPPHPPARRATGWLWPYCHQRGGHPLSCGGGGGVDPNDAVTGEICGGCHKQDCHCIWVGGGGLGDNEVPSQAGVGSGYTFPHYGKPPRKFGIPWATPPPTPPTHPPPPPGNEDMPDKNVAMQRSRDKNVAMQRSREQAMSPRQGCFRGEEGAGGVDPPAWKMTPKGAFAHSARTASIIMAGIPEIPRRNHPPKTPPKCLCHKPFQPLIL